MNSTEKALLAKEAAGEFKKHWPIFLASFSAISVAIALMVYGGYKFLSGG